MGHPFDSSGRRAGMRTARGENITTRYAAARISRGISGPRQASYAMKKREADLHRNSYIAEYSIILSIIQ